MKYYLLVPCFLIFHLSKSHPVCAKDFVFDKSSVMSVATDYATIYVVRNDNPLRIQCYVNFDGPKWEHVWESEFPRKVPQNIKSVKATSWGNEGVILILETEPKLEEDFPRWT